MQNRQADQPEPASSFFEKGGGWVVGQFIVMIGWLVLPPLGHSITRSLELLVSAVVLLALGALAGISGTLVLGRNRTPFPKPRSDSQLVQSGIYSLVRHPLYVCLIALSIGWACLWESELGAVLALVQAIFLDFKARHEERWLKTQFSEYAAYAAKVRRLIPWVY